MILRQAFRNHVRVLEFTITTTLLLLGIWWYLNFDPNFLLVGCLFQAVFTIPALFLHFEYTIRNAGQEIEINENEITIRKGKREQKFNNSELAKIIVYKSASLDKKGMPLSAMEYYYYSRITTKCGKEIIITCLMGRKIDEQVGKLAGVPYERRKRFFCTLIWK